MNDEISRADLLKTAGIAAGGAAALGLALPSVAHAQVPHSTYIQGYVLAAGHAPQAHQSFPQPSRVSSSPGHLQALHRKDGFGR